MLRPNAQSLSADKRQFLNETKRCVHRVGSSCCGQCNRPIQEIVTVFVGWENVAHQFLA